MSELKNCPSCGASISANVKFCPECGYGIQQQTKKKQVNSEDTPGHDKGQSASAAIADQLFKKYQDDIPWAKPEEPEAGSRDQDIGKKMQPEPTKTPPDVLSPVQGVSCNSCGAALQPGKKFCGKCGSPVPAVRSPVPPSTPLCPGCGATIAPGKKFCGKCGIPVPAAPVPIPPVTPPAPLCPGCGTEIKPGKKFCGKCGAPVSTVHAAAQPGAAPPLCPGCGTIIIPGKKFCSKCGVKLP